MASSKFSALQRFSRLQKLQVQQKMDFNYVLKDTLPPLTLFNFSQELDQKQDEIVVGSDEVINGKSRSQVSFPGNQFLRWFGRTDTSIAENSRAVRSGFCSVHFPLIQFGGINLNDFDAFSIKCRLHKFSVDQQDDIDKMDDLQSFADHIDLKLNRDDETLLQKRCYMFNAKCKSFFPDDLYHHFITDPVKQQMVSSSSKTSHPLKPGPKESKDGWYSVVLPFSEFILSSAGRMKEIQLELDNIQLEQISLTLADNITGNFIMDIKKIEAVCQRHLETEELLKRRRETEEKWMK